MLAIQEYLAAGNTPESLAARGVYCYRHPSLPLVGFKYDQIEAAKSDPIVRESRGIVLEDGTWKVVAKSFNRFFNLGEFPEELSKFDWNAFTTTTKEDGSLAIVYYYGEQWHMNTSGSFGLGKVNQTDKTWRELFWETAERNGLRMEKLSHNHTYVFELCTPLNKVVRQYKRPTIYLLGIFHPLDNCYELSEESLDIHADIIGAKRPRRWTLSSREELVEALDSISKEDPTFEGFVIRDWRGNRWKCKTTTYCALHHMKDNGNIILPRRLVEICLKGEKDEVKAIMPEVSTALDEVDMELRFAYANLEECWNKAKDSASQKDFALKVKDHKFSGILFAARKTSQGLDTLWRKDPESIAEKLFAGRSFEFDEV